jgi:hypothetical protein
MSYTSARSGSQMKKIDSNSAGGPAAVATIHGGTGISLYRYPSANEATINGRMIR